jgi:hypothetical protein
MYGSHEDVWGSEGIASSILNFSNRWRSVVSLTPQPFYSWGKNPPYPLDKRLSGPPRAGLHIVEKIKIFFLF